MQPIFEFIRAWQVLGHSETLTIDFDRFKERYFPTLAHCLEDMNWKFGQGEILRIIFNIKECKPDDCYLYGRIVYTKTKKKTDEKYWKLEKGNVVFLSRKRKLKSDTAKHTK